MMIMHLKDPKVQVGRAGDFAGTQRWAAWSARHRGGQSHQRQRPDPGKLEAAA